ncbi:MAG TPA: peptidylprolyl isomerase [Candidatus Acidoferrales bacterium]|nr:peptidylprolyl isomerase [Candidatus Acidoferrales bacterium]
MHRMIAVGLALAAALLACAPATLHAETVVKPLRDDDVVARVNGTPIYRKSVRDVVQGILAVQETAPDPATIGQLADEALDSLISLELLYQESQARNIKVSEPAIDEEIARNRGQFPSPQAFDAALKAKGMSVADLRHDTRKTMSVNRLLESTVWKDLRVTPAQIKDLYEQNKQEFKHPAQIRASHILIRVPQGASAADRSAAKQGAAQLLDRLKAGGDFAQLARERSQDPGSAAVGGDLGYLAKGDMDETFEQAAFALAPGQLSGIVSTPYGFDIIKVTERRDEGFAPLSEVEDRIREVLLKRARQQREADFVAELRKKAQVELVDKGR